MSGRVAATQPWSTQRTEVPHPGQSEIVALDEKQRFAWKAAVSGEILRWAMSEENVEIVARLVDAWNQANVEAMLALFDPECEVIFPPEVPEPGPFHGHTELREWAEGFLAAWESHHAEVVELIEADHSIVAILHLIGQGSGSGIEMDETDAHVFTFRDGKVTRWRNFSDRAKALEGAGLQD